MCKVKKICLLSIVRRVNVQRPLHYGVKAVTGWHRVQMSRNTRKSLLATGNWNYKQGHIMCGTIPKELLHFFGISDKDFVQI